METQEVSRDINLDYDAGHHLVGINIDHASKYLDLGEKSFVKLPTALQAIAAYPGYFYLELVPKWAIFGKMGLLCLDAIFTELQGCRL